jgi:hypothetical protein
VIVGIRSIFLCYTKRYYDLEVFAWCLAVWYFVFMRSRECISG